MPFKKIIERALAEGRNAPEGREHHAMRSYLTDNHHDVKEVVRKLLKNHDADGIMDQLKRNIYSDFVPQKHQKALLEGFREALDKRE